MLLKVGITTTVLNRRNQGNFVPGLEITYSSMVVATHAIGSRLEALHELFYFSAGSFADVAAIIGCTHTIILFRTLAKNSAVPQCLCKILDNDLTIQEVGSIYGDP